MQVHATRKRPLSRLPSKPWNLVLPHVPCRMAAWAGAVSTSVKHMFAAAQAPIPKPTTMEEADKDSDAIKDEPSPASELPK